MVLGNSRTMFFRVSLHQFSILPITCLICFLAFSLGGKAQGKSKDETFSMLIGTWVCTNQNDPHVIKYVRKDSLDKNVKGLIFYESGQIDIYEEFGCQTPLPKFWASRTEWRLNSRKSFTIGSASSMRPEQKYRISKLTKNKLEIEW